MRTIERPDLSASLATALDAQAPAVTWVRGHSGSGASTAVRRALSDIVGSAAPPIVWAVSGSDPTPQRLLVHALASLRRRGVETAAESWSELAADLVGEIERTRRPWIVSVDDRATGLTAVPALASALAELWSGARRGGLPLHLVLVGAARADVDRILGESPTGSRPPIETVDVRHVSIEDVAGHLPRWTGADRLRLQLCLGRSPEVFRHVDPRASWATNVRRLVVDPRGVLHGLVPRRLREAVQKPHRYAGILAALADGAEDWGSIRTASPAFTQGNQLAPYLTALEDRGWIRTRRSLDAAPSSRRRRYALTDALVGFWYGVVEPGLGDLAAGLPVERLWDLTLEDRVRNWIRMRTPFAIREALAEGRTGPLPVPARRLGALWGDGYDLHVGGTLRNGAAIYGLCVSDAPATVADAERLTAQMRATRYGFGREGRIRIVFAERGVTDALARRAARDDLLVLGAVDELF
jgi:hypothetical protein